MHFPWNFQRVKHRAERDVEFFGNPFLLELRFFAFPSLVKKFPPNPLYFLYISISLIDLHPYFYYNRK